MSLVILVTDLLDLRARKQKELDTYQGELNALKLKLGIVQAEITLTTQVIELLEREKLVDLKHMVRLKSVP